MIMKCMKCGYTLENTCKCGNKTVSAHPAKFFMRMLKID
ncbi:MAG: nucleolar RNA-binding Nop10p family protein [Candidatus Aenigmatarchaeota archaeon]